MAESSKRTRDTADAVDEARLTNCDTEDLTADNECLEGDVVISCGDLQSFQVSSQLLSIASPVFKTLLQPGFREGNVRRSASSPLELKLDDDDPAPMRTLLKLIHLAPDISASNNIAKGEEGSNTHIHRLALLADKYGCTKLVYHACSDWMSALEPKAETVSELAMLSHIAFLTRNEHKFRLYTSRMLLHEDSAQLADIPSLCLRGQSRTQSLL